jgi:deoxyribodipyrimidine photo-lyase
LATIAEPLNEERLHTQVPFAPKRPFPQSDYLLLVTGEDCRPEDFLTVRSAGVLGLCLSSEPGQRLQSHAFTKGGIEDALVRNGASPRVATTDDWAKEIITAAQQARTRHVVTSFAPVGPIATKLASVQPELAAAGIKLCQQRRLYDTATWPHATRGFFKLKGMIPTILKDLGFSHVENA